jgi:hypothetical protein
VDARVAHDDLGAEAPQDSEPETQIDPLEIPAFLLRKSVEAAT